MQNLAETNEDRRPRGPADITLIGSRRVREICGGVSQMQLWRWLNEPRYAELEFPQPSCVIGQRNYWRISSIDDFIKRQMAKPARLAKPKSNSAA